MTVIISTIILLGVMGFGFGIFLAFAAKKFEVKEDVRTIAVQASLPGINCGACGFPGCSGFAKAYIENRAKNDGCLPGRKSGVPQKLEKISKLTDDQLQKLFEEAEGDIEKTVRKIMEN